MCRPSPEPQAAWTLRGGLGVLWASTGTASRSPRAIVAAVPRAKPQARPACLFGFMFMVSPTPHFPLASWPLRHSPTTTLPKETGRVWPGGGGDLALRWAWAGPGGNGLYGELGTVVGTQGSGRHWQAHARLHAPACLGRDPATGWCLGGTGVERKTGRRSRATQRRTKAWRLQVLAATAHEPPSGRF